VVGDVIHVVSTNESVILSVEEHAMRLTFACLTFGTAALACGSNKDAGGGVGGSSSASSSSSKASVQASSTQAAVATVGAGGGGSGGAGGAGMNCDPPADPTSLYARDDFRLDMTKESMCKYRKKVLLAVNTAGA
jgi:hypothetical protein